MEERLAFSRGSERVYSFIVYIRRQESKDFYGKFHPNRFSRDNEIDRQSYLEIYYLGMDWIQIAICKLHVKMFEVPIIFS